VEKGEADAKKWLSLREKIHIKKGDQKENQERKGGLETASRAGTRNPV